MTMAVMMFENRQRFCVTGSKQRAILRRIGDDLRRTFTADMAIEAQNPVRGGHHHMQIMADHQDCHAGTLAHLFDLPIKRRSARLVQPLRGLVKDQNIR